MRRRISKQQKGGEGEKHDEDAEEDKYELNGGKNNLKPKLRQRLSICDELKKVKAGLSQFQDIESFRRRRKNT